MTKHVATNRVSGYHVRAKTSCQILFLVYAPSVGLLPAGGMRQVGVLAAPGLVALQQTPALLPMDHKNARLFAEGEPPVLRLLVLLLPKHCLIVACSLCARPECRYLFYGLRTCGSLNRIHPHAWKGIYVLKLYTCPFHGQERRGRETSCRHLYQSFATLPVWM